MKRLCLLILSGCFSAGMGTVIWYAHPSGDTAIASGTSFVTPALNVTTAYYMDATTGECTSPSRMKVTTHISYADSCRTAGQVFAPTGAVWYYDEGWAFSGDIGYMKFRSEKDTLFKGRTCQKLVKEKQLLCLNRPKVEFLSTSNDTVFFWDPDFGAFQILYIFSGVKNDVWSLNILDEDSTVDTLTIRVDDTYLSSINGRELRTLNVTYEKKGQGPYSFPYSSKIIEKIGDIQYMFNWYPWEDVACDMNYSAGLRCYEDEEIGLYSTGKRDSCNFVLHPFEPLTLYSPSWNVVKGNLWGVGTDSMVLKGDTTIDGKHYYKIYYYDLPSNIKLDVEGYLRENINTGQAWYRASVDSEDKLIMDLSLQVGDSFYVEGPWNSFQGYRRVDSAWTEYGRKFVRVDANINPAFGGLYKEKLTFIEGVGTNIGVGYKVFNYMDNFPYLLCAYKYNTLIYRNNHPDYKDVCVLCTTNTEKFSGSSGITVFPNPTKGMLTLDLAAPLHYNFHITDITGRSLGSGEISGFQLDLSGYREGIYILTLWPDKDFTKAQVFKIVKQ